MLLQNSKWKISRITARESCRILHKIGLIYRRRSSNKISLIQSVGLLNAAIFRHSLNTAQIKSDLFELIKHILTQAKAKTPNVDLVKKACNLKKMMTDLSQKKKYSKPKM